MSPFITFFWHSLLKTLFQSTMLASVSSNFTNFTVRVLLTSVCYVLLHASSKEALKHTNIHWVSVFGLQFTRKKDARQRYKWALAEPGISGKSRQWVLRNKKVPKKLKVLIYKTVIRPVVLYKDETCPLTDYLAERFGVCEMRMFWYWLKISLEELKTNESTRQEANGMIALDWKRRRWQCFKHVCRKERRRHSKKNWGRSKHRWKDTIRKDLHSCSLSEEDAQYRIKWKSLIELGLQQAPAYRQRQNRDMRLYRWTLGQTYHF